MKHLVIIAAVVLICQSAKVPQEVTHQVSAVIPTSVLTPPDSSKDLTKPVTNAKVVEVSKDHKPTKDVGEKVVPEVQNVVKANVMPAVEEMKRKTRAVTATEQGMVMSTVKLGTSEPEKIMKIEPKTVMMTTMMPVTKTTQPAMTETNRRITVMPDIKTMQVAKEVQIPDKKMVILTTEQPESKTAMPSVTDMKRKTRNVMATVMPDIKIVQPAKEDQIPVKKMVILTTEQPESKTVMPTVTEMKRKARAVTATSMPDIKAKQTAKEVHPVDKKLVIMATAQPDSKTVMPSTTDMKRNARAVTAPSMPDIKAKQPAKDVRPVDTKMATMTTEQPESKTVMPSVTEMKRNARAVTAMPDIKAKQPAEEVHPVDKKLVIMATAQPEAQTVMPSVTEMKRKTRSVMTTKQPEVKTMKTSVVPSMTEIKRKARAVMVTESPRMNTVKPSKKVQQVSSVDTKKQPLMPTMEELMRKVRAVMTTEQPEVKTMKDSVEDAVAKVEKKSIVMTTMTPETKTVTTSVKELKRKARAVVATEKSQETTKKSHVLVSQKDSKTVIINTEKNAMKTVMPQVMEQKRLARAIMTTMKPEEKKLQMATVQQPKVVSETIVMTTIKPETKTVMATVQPIIKTEQTAKNNKHVPKAVDMTTIQPETKTVMPTVKQTKRNRRAVPFQDNDGKKSYKSLDKKPWNAQWTQKADSMVINKMHSHRAMRSVEVKITTLKPVTVDTTSQVIDKDVVKTSEAVSVKLNTKSSIDPCDLLCTKFEFEPICASNGLCLHEFPNQCILDTFNCKHPKGKFSATKDDSCQMSWLTKCEESDII